MCISARMLRALALAGAVMVLLLLDGCGSTSYQARGPGRARAAGSNDHGNIRTSCASTDGTSASCCDGQTAKVGAATNQAQTFTPGEIGASLPGNEVPLEVRLMRRLGPRPSVVQVCRARVVRVIPFSDGDKMTQHLSKVLSAMPDEKRREWVDSLKEDARQWKDFIGVVQYEVMDWLQLAEVGDARLFKQPGSVLNVVVPKNDVLTPGFRKREGNAREFEVGAVHRLELTEALPAGWEAIRREFDAPVFACFACLRADEALADSRPRPPVVEMCRARVVRVLAPDPDWEDFVGIVRYEVIEWFGGSDNTEEGRRQPGTVVNVIVPKNSIGTPGSPQRMGNAQSFVTGEVHRLEITKTFPQDWAAVRVKFQVLDCFACLRADEDAPR